MSVDTKIRIPFNTNYLEVCNNIMDALKAKFGTKLLYCKLVDYKLDTHKTAVACGEYEYSTFTARISLGLDYACKEFEDNKEHTYLSLYYCEDTDKSHGDFMCLSLFASGHNEEIAQCLVDAFGGIADYNDCDDIKIDYARAEPKRKTND